MPKPAGTLAVGFGELLGCNVQTSKMKPQEHILLAENNLTTAEANLDEIEGASPFEKFKLQKLALNALATARQEVFLAQSALEAEIMAS